MTITCIVFQEESATPSSSSLVAEAIGDDVGHGGPVRQVIIDELCCWLLLLYNLFHRNPSSCRQQMAVPELNASALPVSTWLNM